MVATCPLIAYSRNVRNVPESLFMCRRSVETYTSPSHLCIDSYRKYVAVLGVHSFTKVNKKQHLNFYFIPFTNFSCDMI